MHLTPEEAEHALESAAIDKVKHAIQKDYHADQVDLERLAIFLVREFKPRITMEDLPVGAIKRK